MLPGAPMSVLRHRQQTSVLKVILCFLINRQLFPTRMGVFPSQFLLHFFYQEIVDRQQKWLPAKRSWPDYHQHQRRTGVFEEAIARERVKNVLTVRSSRGKIDLNWFYLYWLLFFLCKQGVCKKIPQPPMDWTDRQRKQRNVEMGGWHATDWKVCMLAF